MFDDILQMDEYIDNYLKEISGYSIDALSENKKLLWQGTENWPQIMSERAAISGRLALNAEL